MKEKLFLKKKKKNEDGYQQQNMNNKIKKLKLLDNNKNYCFYLFITLILNFFNMNF